ncbi:MAG: hypothetical protein ABIC04_08090 [Nanoarchaeota archaeon]
MVEQSVAKTGLIVAGGIVAAYLSFKGLAHIVDGDTSQNINENLQSITDAATAVTYAAADNLKTNLDNIANQFLKFSADLYGAFTAAAYARTKYN